MKLARLERGVEVERSDAALVEACARGDEAALGELFDRHAESLACFLARARASTAIDVEDLVQQAFMVVWRSAPRFRGGSAVRTWILGIGVNVLRNESRGTKRRLLAIASYEKEPQSRPPRPDEMIEEKERLSRFEAALAQLTHDQRVAFVMCELERVPGVEAARVLGVPPGTIWRRLSDARRALVLRMKEEER